MAKGCKSKPVTPEQKLINNLKYNKMKKVEKVRLLELKSKVAQMLMIRRSASLAPNPMLVAVRLHTNVYNVDGLALKIIFVRIAIAKVFMKVLRKRNLVIYVEMKCWYWKE